MRGALEAPLKGSEMGRKGVKSSDIIEPLAVKLQIVSASAEAACMILRIDDVIATQKSDADRARLTAGILSGASDISKEEALRVRAERKAAAAAEDNA